MKLAIIRKLFLALTILNFPAQAQNNGELSKGAIDSPMAIRIVSIDDTEGIIASLSYSPKTTIQNKGCDTETCFLFMEISNGYLCKKEITLPKNAAITVLFDEVMLAKGSYVFKVKVLSNNGTGIEHEILTKNVTVASDSLTFK